MGGLYREKGEFSGKDLPGEYSLLGSVYASDVLYSAAMGELDLPTDRCPCGKSGNCCNYFDLLY